MSCYNGTQHNLKSWCLYHNGIYTNKCRFNDKNTSLNAANDPLNICIYNWKRCNTNKECERDSGHSYCVKYGCCSPGYCMVSKRGAFSITNYNNRITLYNCQEIGGKWNKTNNECMWYEIQCG